VPYTLFTLDNGLTVIVHTDRATPRISVNAWYHVGSGREKPGRTGFAHLFEHIMYEGSANVPEGKYDQWLEATGAGNNGSTTEDRTNYYVDGPANTLDLALFLESDRMGHLLGSMAPETVDGQRDVVKNERRQSYENRPYGMADLAMPALMFPDGHPYSWPVIGSMEDLSAAAYDDVVDFFKRYYGPGNAVLAIAGDVDVETVRAAVEKWFADVPASEPVPPLEHPRVTLSEEKRLVLEDKVQLPKLILTWPTVEAFHPADSALGVLAEILAGGKTSRLYRTLVYDKQIAQRVIAYHYGQKIAGQLVLEVTGRKGQDLKELLTIVDDEIRQIQEDGVTARETQRAIHGVETQFLDALERIGGFGGKANQLNYYYFYTGNPDYFAEDLARYMSLAPSDIRMAARNWLGPNRVMVSVVPEGQTQLAVPQAKEDRP